MHVVSQNLDLLDQSCLVFRVHVSAECIAHDGNQHVKEHDLRNQGNEHEQSPGDRIATVYIITLVIFGNVGIEIKLSERHLVLTKKDIECFNADVI